MAAPKALPWATTVVYDPTKPLPSFSELPRKHGLPCAWSVWGAGDQLGTINLLQPSVVKAAAALVQDGLSVSLNLPVQFPSKPSFHRKTPVVTVMEKWGLETPVRDEEIHMNSQSGTQWDGLRHFGILKGGCFYQGVPAKEIKAGELEVADPLAINPDDIKLGIHHWAAHGITSRGVFLDLVSWYTRDGQALPYDPCTTHSISLDDIKACAAYQGTTFQIGDILILRIGWTQRYYASSQDEKNHWGAGGNEHFAGVENSAAMQEWLWDNHFAAVASDQPAFEAWPPAEGEVFLHSTIIGCYGSPIGEFFDCEELSRVCAEKKRYTFFFVSNPLALLGGCASTGNASAIF